MEDFDNSTTSTDQGLIQVKPETSRDEQLAFIDTMREIQSGQNQEIQDTTHALGSDVTPEFGGINGTNSYWLSRYQIPQTESRIATLRAAAQSSALNTALNNYLNRLQEDYNNAYRRANKRARNRAKAAALAANSPTSPTNNSPEGKGEVDNTESYTATPEGLWMDKKRREDAEANAAAARKRAEEANAKATQAREENQTQLYTDPKKAAEAWKNILK